MTTETLHRSASETPFVERRRHKRYAVEIEAILHCGGRSQATIVNDLSAGGAGLDRAIGVTANDAVEIEFAGGRRIAATVAWRVSGCCGIQFATPLAAGDPLLPSDA